MWSVPRTFVPAFLAFAFLLLGAATRARRPQAHVTMGKGKITAVGLPARAAVAELTMCRLKKVDGAPKRNAVKLRARVAPTGTTLKVRTKRLR